MTLQLVKPATVGLIYQRTPQPEWVDRLRDITGDAPALPSLSLHWEPGDEWGPVQRWLAYMTWPDEQIRPEYIEQCKGPHPRSAGAFNARLGFWEGGPAPLITRSQWEIYRAVGRYAEPFWVIQGTLGGHKYRLTKWESKLSVLCNGPKDTPVPGALPYAEPDERTWNALAAADRMRERNRTLEYMFRRPFEFTASELEAAQTVAKEVLQWIGLRSSEHADELAWALKRESLIPRPKAGHTVKELDEDQVLHEHTADLVREMASNPT